jgi:putative membrane protein
MRISLSLLALSLGMAGVSPALAAPGAFLAKAIKGDNAEMRLGKLAQTHGQSAAVRRFGATLARDHGTARRAALPVARRHGVAIPDGMTDEAQAEYAKLDQLRGPSFDREFARYMVEDHRKDIAAFSREAASRDPGDVRALVRQTLPALRRHLRMARALG